MIVCTNVENHLFSSLLITVISYQLSYTRKYNTCSNTEPCKEDSDRLMSIYHCKAENISLHCTDIVHIYYFHNITLYYYYYYYYYSIAQN